MVGVAFLGPASARRPGCVAGPASGDRLDGRGLSDLGRLAASTQARGAPVSENDIWIAACCLSEGLPLVTRNMKDFVDFAEHHGLVLITE